MHNSDPNLNENALKENTDLRVDKTTLRRDLGKVRKQLARSERDVENLRRQVSNDAAERDRSKTDGGLREEIVMLKKALEIKDVEIRTFQESTTVSERELELKRLQEDNEDLGAELREKDRIIDAKEDELEIANARVKSREDMVDQQAKATEENERLQAKIEDLYREIQDTNQDVEIAKKNEAKAHRERDSAVREVESVCEAYKYIVLFSKLL